MIRPRHPDSSIARPVLLPVLCACAQSDRARHRRHFRHGDGHQQLRLFNAFYDEYGFQPIVVFDGEGRPVGALLRPARRPKGAESATHIRRLIRQIRRHWPDTEILLRADSHYSAPEVLDLCDRLGPRYVFGLSKNSRLAEATEALETSTAAR